MDVWVNFTNATNWQAKGIFKCFFPYKPAEPKEREEHKGKAKDASKTNLPLPRRKTTVHNIPLLSEDELNTLAEKFGEAIPEDELSVSGVWRWYLSNSTLTGVH